MQCNRIMSTSELKEHINSVYSKLESITKMDGVYKQLDDLFGHVAQRGLDGYYCYSDNEGYHYDILERGILRKSVLTQNLDEITYLVLSSDIFWMACVYECKHRIEGQDFRHLLFHKEMQYWRVLGREYAVMAEQKILEILIEVPFSDELG